MHMSIAGKLGSGKSTISNILKAKYGFQTYSTGAIQREIAQNNKVSTLEMNRLMAKDISFDHAIDDAVTKISVERAEEVIIFDSRMAWKFAVNSFKIFVTVDPLEAASRVIKSRRGKEETYADLEEAKLKLFERSRLENERFKEIYGVDNFDYSNYNLIIDSTYLAPDMLADIVYSKYQAYCNSSDKMNVVALSPASLYPLKEVKDINTETINKYRKERTYLHDHVTITVFDGYHYIIDGHHRVLAALLNEEDLITVKPADTEEFPLIKETERSTLHDFEKAGNFQYKSYP